MTRRDPTLTDALTGAAIVGTIFAAVWSLLFAFGLLIEVIA